MLSDYCGALGDFRLYIVSSPSFLHVLYLFFFVNKHSEYRIEQSENCIYQTMFSGVNLLCPFLIKNLYWLHIIFSIHCVLHRSVSDPTFSFSFLTASLPILPLYTDCLLRYSWSWPPTTMLLSNTATIRILVVFLSITQRPLSVWILLWWFSHREVISSSPGLCGTVGWSVVP